MECGCPTAWFWVATQEKTDISTIPASPFVAPWPAAYPTAYPGAYPYNYGRWGPMYNEVVVHNYTEGSLVLDLVDTQRDELMWRAYIVGTVVRDRDQAFAALDEALARAFAAYPPGATPTR